jgi:hypothetical protein
VDDIVKLFPVGQRACIILYADDILILAPSVCEVQKLFNICEVELTSLGMSINVKKSCCLRIGPRCNINCASITTSAGVKLPWVSELRYLGVHIVQSRTFKCSLRENKKSFYRGLNAIIGKVGRIASEEVILQLVFTKCIPMLLYGLEALPLTLADKRSLDFVFHRYLMKLFKTANILIVKDCMTYFGVQPPTDILDKRCSIFLSKHSTMHGLFHSYRKLALKYC